MKTFPISVIITFYDGRLLTTMDAVYEFANFMTDDDLMTHQLPRAFREVKPVLENQLPFLASPEFQNERQFLTRQLEGDKSSADKEIAIKSWLKIQSDKFGLSHEVAPLSDWMRQNPISELIQMREGRDGILVVKSS